MEKFGSPALHQLQHGGALHEAFISFRDVTGMQKKNRWSSFSGPSRYEKAARIPQLLQGGFISRTQRAISLSPQAGSAAVSSLRGRCPRRDRRNDTPLGQCCRNAAMETSSLLEYYHVSCLRTSVAYASSFGADGSAAPRQSTSLGAGYTVQDIQMTTCPGGVARSRRNRKSSKQSLRLLSPSHPARRTRSVQRLGASCRNRSHRRSRIFCTTTLQKEWPDTSVLRKHDRGHKHAEVGVSAGLFSACCSRGQERTLFYRCCPGR